MGARYKVNFHGDSLEYVLKTNVHIRNAFDLKRVVQCQAIWDTGAVYSAITAQCAKELGLTPLETVKAVSASGQFDARLYLIRIEIEGLGLSIVAEALECELLHEAKEVGLLIGMNVISKGDLMISNLDGRTSLSFRIPPDERIEF